MCFTLGWLEQLIVWLIVIVAVVAIIRLLIPFLDSLTSAVLTARRQRHAWLSPPKVAKSTICLRIHQRHPRSAGAASKAVVDSFNNG